MNDLHERFTGRSSDYRLARPSYPAAAVDAVVEGLEPGARVADLGCGTGIFAGLLLERGVEVLGIEPNADMRARSEELLESWSGFQTLDGTSERTGLAAASVDRIVVAQAFHWFEVEPTRREFRRILRPGAEAVLVWNQRKEQSTGFLHDYDQLLRTWGVDYEEVLARYDVRFRLDSFFEPATYRLRLWDNEQRLDQEGLWRRVLSCSYIPTPPDPRAEGLREATTDLFEKWQRGGTVTLEYEVEVYSGRPCIG